MGREEVETEVGVLEDGEEESRDEADGTGL